MRDGELCYVETYLDKGMIKVYSDEPLELDNLLAVTFERIREMGICDLFDIITIVGAEANNEDFNWALLDTNLDAYLSWTIEHKPSNDVGYKYVATITGFRRMEL